MYYIGTKLIKSEPGRNENGEEGYRVQYSDGYTRLPSGVSIGPQMVEDFIKEKHVSTIGDKTTLVRVVLVNGFEIIESSACVDKSNYNENIGADVCMNKIKDKIWMLLGFLLQTAYKGIK